MKLSTYIKAAALTAVISIGGLGAFAFHVNATISAPVDREAIAAKLEAKNFEKEKGSVQRYISAVDRAALNNSLAKCLSDEDFGLACKRYDEFKADLDSIKEAHKNSEISNEVAVQSVDDRASKHFYKWESQFDRF